MNTKFMKRGAGLLLHISSLPSKYGIGSLGKSAFDFVDFLKISAQRYWQILPITPTGISNSPYQSYSAFASNPYFIDLEQLYSDGLLSLSDLSSAEAPQSYSVNFKKVKRTRDKLLRKAFLNFNLSDEDFSRYSADQTRLEYGCYMALKDEFKTAWYNWDDEYKFFSKKLLKKVSAEHSSNVNYHIFVQYIFDRQWQRLKEYSRENGVSIIGDMPIYLDYDSVESWAHPELLQLDPDLKPLGVAGVPPDYFSETGQLWGNPLYDWDYHERTNFKWWKQRIAAICEKCDLVRIDHFRGFHEYYSIEPNATSARQGEWKKGAGTKLFDSLSASLKKRIIAEDLGLLDQGAYDFFAKVGFPGMKVLEFAFDGNQDNPHLPRNHIKNSVVYTGTHDNDTLNGWLSSISNFPEVKKRINAAAKEMGLANRATSKSTAIELLVELAYSSESNICIIPIQDHLYLPSKNRMNTPGTVNSRNWTFRLESIPLETSIPLRMLSQNYKRKL